jgi:hypothetical protein
MFNRRLWLYESMTDSIVQFRVMDTFSEEYLLVHYNIDLNDPVEVAYEKFKLTADKLNEH